MDRFNLIAVTTAAIGVCLLGAILFWSSSTLSLLFIARILMGMGAAFATVAFMRAAAIYFDSIWFARLSGFFGTACMSGAGSTLLIFGSIRDHFGYSSSLLVSCIFAAAMLIFGCILVISQKMKHRHSLTKSDSNIVKKKFNWDTLATTIKSRNNLLLLLYGGLAFSPLTVFGGLWGPSYLMHVQHLSSEQTHFAISWIFYGFAIGGPILASLFKTTSQQKWLMIIGVAIACILFTILLYAPPAWFNYKTIILLMFTIGFFNSSFLLSYALAKKLNAVSMIATVMAVINMGDPLFGGVAEPLIGHIMDNFATAKFSLVAYQTSLSVLILFWLSGCVAGYYIKLKPCHSRVEKKHNQKFQSHCVCS